MLSFMCTAYYKKKVKKFFRTVKQKHVPLAAEDESMIHKSDMWLQVTF